MDEKPPGLFVADGFEYFTVGNGGLIAMSTAPISPRDDSKKKGATLDSTQTVLKIRMTWIHRNSACVRHPNRVPQTS
jgi:hypothetical protein